MPNVIDFLEKMGQDSRLRYAAAIDIEDALVTAEVDAGLRSAVVEADQSQLEVLLDARKKLCCAIFPVEGDDSHT